MQLYTLKICKHFLKTFPETTYICYQLKQIANHEAFDFFFMKIVSILIQFGFQKHDQL